MSGIIIKNTYDEIKYKLAEQDFDGPLDLLLTLIKDAKVDIKDIFIKNITQQYLDYVAGMETVDFEYAAEFISMAATLIEIKSRSMLPKTEIDVETAEDPETDLIRRLEEYRLFKEASEKLQGNETLNRFYRNPMFSEDDYRVVIKNFSLERLIEAFSMLLDRIEHFDKNPEPKTILKERFSVSEKFGYILDLLIKHREILFFDLFDRDFTPIEIINTFLAVLELLNKEAATAEQADSCGDIVLKINPDYKKQGDSTDVDEYA
jgi:segregation and condensation protein A